MTSDDLPHQVRGDLGTMGRAVRSAATTNAARARATAAAVQPVDACTRGRVLLPKGQLGARPGLHSPALNLRGARRVLRPPAL